MVNLDQRSGNRKLCKLSCAQKTVTRSHEKEEARDRERERSEIDEK